MASELEYTNSIYKLCVDGFCSNLISYCDSNGIENPLEKLSEKKEKKETKDLSPQLKKIFRDIAKQTHTDISKNDKTRSTLEKAVEAKKTSNATKLLSIAKDLKIDTNSLDYKSIKIIESSIVKMEKEIESIKNSYPWLWYHSNTLTKEKIIVSFIESQV